MSEPTPQLRDLAARLIALETGGSKSSGPKNGAAFPVYEKLRPQLVTLMGNAGFYALVSRALARAQAEAPSLRAILVNPDGSLAGQDQLKEQGDPNKLAKGRMSLIAHLLGLLTLFIGETLTRRLLCEVWPKLPLHDPAPSEGDENEYIESRG